MAKIENWSYIIREGVVIVHGEIMSMKETNSCLNEIITVGVDWGKTADPDINGDKWGIRLEGSLYLNNGKCYNWFSLLSARAEMSCPNICLTAKHRLGYLDAKNCNNHRPILCREDDPCKGTT